MMTTTKTVKNPPSRMGDSKHDVTAAQHSLARIMETDATRAGGGVSDPPVPNPLASSSQNGHGPPGIPTPVRRPPPFLQKTWEMVSEVESNDIVSWSESGRSFVVWRPDVIQTTLLPKFFKHSNYSSFVRQLNTYGFRKINSDRWEFAHPSFIQGEREKLASIVRKRPNKPPSSAPSAPGLKAGAEGMAATMQQPSVAGRNLDGNAVPLLMSPVEVGQYGGFADDLERLRRDNSLLTMEIMRLRQAQTQSNAALETLSQRLSSTEQMQQQMLTALTQAIERPEFFQQLLQHISSLQKGDRSSQRKRRAIRSADPSDGLAENKEVANFNEADITSDGFGPPADVFQDSLDVRGSSANEILDVADNASLVPYMKPERALISAPSYDFKDRPNGALDTRQLSLQFAPSSYVVTPGVGGGEATVTTGNTPVAASAQNKDAFDKHQDLNQFAPELGGEQEYTGGSDAVLPPMDSVDDDILNSLLNEFDFQIS